eukprot:scaffold58203_cov54-Phaeocystis_antarctica.AAC.3
MTKQDIYTCAARCRQPGNNNTTARHETQYDACELFFCIPFNPCRCSRESLSTATACACDARATGEPDGWRLSGKGWQNLLFAASWQLTSVSGLPRAQA